MWESPIYKFEEEVTEKGKIVKRPFIINVTYSAPRNLEDPGKALCGVFNKITEGLVPAEMKVLDVGAAKLRNTLWLLEKGFQVWAVEFPELSARLPDAKKKWDLAERNYPNFHKVTFPKDFVSLKEKFDIIIMVNEINVMPIPLERFILLSLCRERIKKDGKLLWHQWRGCAVGQDKYSKDNEFIDGYLMGTGPHHTFYVEHNREQTFEMLYSVGFSFDTTMNLHKIPANSCYSYIFNPTHSILIDNSLDAETALKTMRDPNKIISSVDKVSVLDLYIKELKTIPAGKDDAHKFHLISSRIFFEIFKNQLKEPVIEREINEGRGRIDITYDNKNKEGIFKNLKDLRDVPCPEIMVECKNYANDLTNNEYQQLGDRLAPQKGMLGFLLCRDKKNKKKVIQHCKDRHKNGANKYIIVLDDKDLIELAGYKLNEEDDELINKFIDKKIKEILD